MHTVFPVMPERWAPTLSPSYGTTAQYTVLRTRVRPHSSLRKLWTHYSERTSTNSSDQGVQRVRNMVLRKKLQRVAKQMSFNTADHNAISIHFWKFIPQYRKRESKSMRWATKEVARQIFVSHGVMPVTKKDLTGPVLSATGVRTSCIPVSEITTWNDKDDDWLGVQLQSSSIICLPSEPARSSWEDSGGADSYYVEVNVIASALSNQCEKVASPASSLQHWKWLGHFLLWCLVSLSARIQQNY